MFRFSIRDVLWLTSLCAVAIYAYSDRRTTRLKIAASEAVQASERAKLERSRADFERERATINASLTDSQVHLNKQAVELNKEAQRMAHDMGEIRKLQEKLRNEARAPTENRP
jgi:valyl-tRNA synthetase